MFHSSALLHEVERQCSETQTGYSWHYCSYSYNMHLLIVWTNCWPELGQQLTDKTG